MPLLFDPPEQRSEAHLADLRALAGLFDDGDEFLERELAGSEQTAVYRLQGSGLRVVIRHRSRDLGVVDEIFRRRFYALPPAVEEVLDSVGRPPVVADLGAHIGLFCVWMAERYPGARITAYEPDGFNFELLERCVEENAGRLHCEPVHAAASSSAGEVPFVEGDFAGSHAASSGDPSTQEVTQLDVLPDLAGADLLKADVEGGEWDVIADPRLASTGLRAIVLEYHPKEPAAPDPREEVERLLAEAGFTSVERLFHRPDGVGMLWAWRED